MIRRAFACATLLALASRAHADCAIPDRFADALRAARVVIARVSAARTGNLRVTLEVEQVLKGAKEPRSFPISFNPLAGESYQDRRRYLVFVDGEGKQFGGCSALWLERERPAPAVKALREFLGARTPEDQVAVLVRWGVGRDRDISRDALAHLSARPDLLAAVDEPARRLLRDAIPEAIDDRVYALARVLARLHAVDAVPRFVEWLATNHPNANARPVQDALELLTNHHDPAYEVGRDFYGEQATKLREGWQKWVAVHGKQDVGTFVAAGFAERKQAAPSLTDRKALRAVLQSNADPLSCSVALDACERLTKAPSTRLPTYAGGGTDWPSLAGACD